MVLEFMRKKEFKRLLKKTWYFIWEENSAASWLVNILLAFVLIYFIVYPGLGFLFKTSHPVVAVVSESMEHNMRFERWWEDNRGWYTDNGITRTEFEKFSLKNGFNKGDIMVLIGAENIEVGDVIVFRSQKRDPIIHRVVKIDNGVFQTKGDNNRDSIRSGQLDETMITQDLVIGKAFLRIPLLGYIKILFTQLVGQPYCKITVNFFPCRS
jgi:signal peptidase I